MAWQEYSIAVGHDEQASVANFETYISNPMRGERVPDGSVVRVTEDGNEHVHGRRLVALSVEAALFAHLTAYVTAIFGGWDGPQTVDVTLKWRKPDNSYAYYNAKAFKPRAGVDFEFEHSQAVVGLRLRFRILQEVAAP